MSVKPGEDQERYNLLESFNDADRQIVDGMYEAWHEIREQLMNAIDTKDRVTMHKTLQELEKINKHYLEIASHRYHEIISDHI